MFLQNQKTEEISYYKEMLGVIGALSRLFSESDEPYIQYRIAENLFCKSFKAENLSRTDCSADASKNKLGIGIKTFLEKNGATTQKIAEFNSEHELFRGLEGEEKIFKVASLRNERLETTKRIFGLEKMIYHCVTRKKNKILVYETPMDLINLGEIKNVFSSKNTISFQDNLNEYSFNVTKSTLYKRFITEKVLLDFPVKILDNPFEALEKFLIKTEEKILPIKKESEEHIFLPLYSYKNGSKKVPEKSGLNLWNSGGRSRNPNEVYIPIPAKINGIFSDFFPSRETPFVLLLPNGLEMSAKVCQDNSKALMSNPNSALGQWLLRDVLNLQANELLTYEKLERIGLDSVVVYKISDGRYDIDFTKIGSYEKFLEENNIESRETEEN